MSETVTKTEEPAGAIAELRYARNAYKSSVAAADGFVSGRRVASMKIAEARLRDLLWTHRDLLVELALQQR